MRPVVLARVFAGVGAIWWGFFFFGLIDLMVPFVQETELYDAYLLETGWGLLYTGLVAVPLLALVVRPRSVGPAAQLVAASAAVTVPALLVPEPVQLLPAAGLFMTTVVQQALARRAHQSDPADGGEWSPQRLRVIPYRSWALALAAAAAAVPSATDMIAAARSGRYPVDITYGIDHWPTQASLALCIPAAAAVAALRPSGWRVPAWTAAVSAVWFGVLSLVYPEHAGSAGQAWGLACVI